MNFNRSSCCSDSFRVDYFLSSLPFKNAEPGTACDGAPRALDSRPLAAGICSKKVCDGLHVDLRSSIGIQRHNDAALATPAFDLDAQRDPPRQQAAAPATQRAFGLRTGAFALKLRTRLHSVFFPFLRQPKSRRQKRAQHESLGGQSFHRRINSEQRRLGRKPQGRRRDPAGGL